MSCSIDPAWRDPRPNIPGQRSSANPAPAAQPETHNFFTMAHAQKLLTVQASVAREEVRAVFVSKPKTLK